jgi:hypothetical protein
MLCSNSNERSESGNAKGGSEGVPHPGGVQPATDGARHITAVEGGGRVTRLQLLAW